MLRAAAIPLEHFASVVDQFSLARQRCGALGRSAHPALELGRRFALQLFDRHHGRWLRQRSYRFDSLIGDLLNRLDAFVEPGRPPNARKSPEAHLIEDRFQPAFEVALLEVGLRCALVRPIECLVMELFATQIRSSLVPARRAQANAE
jgi:hypothetical protein